MYATHIQTAITCFVTRESRRDMMLVFNFLWSPKKEKVSIAFIA